MDCQIIKFLTQMERRSFDHPNSHLSAEEKETLAALKHEVKEFEDVQVYRAVSGLA
jgi:hypothetical protein